MPDVMTYGCSISGPLGAIQLEQTGVYKLGSETRGTRQVSQRKVEAVSSFVEGSFPVRSVRDNVTETLAVYVYANDAATLKTRIKALTDALDQINYTISFTTEGSTETWNCTVADYTINEQHEFQHSYLALVRANVPRRPTVVIT